MRVYLLKFFENKQFQNEFLEGKLYMNTLKFFKDGELLDIARTDKLEAVQAHMTPDLMQIGMLNIPKSECGIMTINTTKYDLCNVLCLYTLCKETQDGVTIIDDKIKNFGDYCVCITDIKEFLKRVVRATDKNDFVCHHMKVNYINKNLEYKIKEKEVPFTKFDNFNYQREFRVAINTKRNMNQHYILEVGSLKDIAFISTIYKINDDLNLK